MIPRSVPSSPAALASPWIVRVRPRPAARLRLFCLPYAGAGASAYATWGAELPDETTGPFAVAMFPGDHFYLRTHRARLLAVLATELRALRH